MKFDDIKMSDKYWQEEVDKWESEADAMRTLIAAVAGLYESYRGGPFGVCQRTLRDVERQCFFFAHKAKERFPEAPVDERNPWDRANCSKCKCEVSLCVLHNGLCVDCAPVRYHRRSKS